MAATFSLYVNDLVNDALRTARLYTAFQDLAPDYVTNGLKLLQIEISKINASGSIIPYQSDLDFTINSNQAEYTISLVGTPDVNSAPFIEVNYIDVFFNSIQYPVRIISDKNALDVFRSTNIVTIPESARVHQSTDGLTTTIIFFTPPNQSYDCKIRGKKVVGYPDLQDTITDLPQYFYEFFMLRVAKRLTSFYGNNAWTQDLELDLQRAESLVMQASDWDLWVRSPGALTRKDLYLYNTYLGVRVP